MTREEITKVKAGEFLTTRYGSIILVEHVELRENGVCVYHYFDYDKEMGLQMNEWLRGSYGPSFDDEFYRYSTEEEKRFFLSELKKYGYRLEEMYGTITPVQTKEEYFRHRYNSEKGLDEASRKYAENTFSKEDEFDTAVADFKAGAKWESAQGETYEGSIRNNRFCKLEARAEIPNDSQFKFGERVIIQIRRP